MNVLLPGFIAQSQCILKTAWVTHMIVSMLPFLSTVLAKLSVKAGLNYSQSLHHFISKGKFLKMMASGPNTAMQLHKDFKFNQFHLSRQQFLSFVHCKNVGKVWPQQAHDAGQTVWTAQWEEVHQVLWRPSEFPAPNPLVHTSTLLAKGTSLGKAEVLLSLYEKAAKSDQEEALRWVKQTETFAFSLPIYISFQLFL